MGPHSLPLGAAPRPHVSVGVGEGSDPVSLAGYINGRFDPALHWRHVDWFRERWSGSVVLKGIQCVEDARSAAEHGVDAVALPNLTLLTHSPGCEPGIDGSHPSRWAFMPAASESGAISGA